MTSAGVQSFHRPTRRAVPGLRQCVAPWLCALALASALPAADDAYWTVQATQNRASLRGLSAVGATTAWATGSKGTVLRSTDGGRSWQAQSAPADAAQLDFRAVHAFSATQAVLMSVGNGDTSRVYWTEDAGAHWTLALTNHDEKGFYDAIAFWTRERGLLLGDPVDGRFTVLTTDDGGRSWHRIAASGMPSARDGEGAFAASGTCLVTAPGGRAWFATGGPTGARVFRSTDWGRTWTAAETPVRHDAAAAGVFSLAFVDAQHGIAVGGDYTKLTDATANLALTEDGGATWHAAHGAGPSGFRSAVAALDQQGQRWITTGPGGTDVSEDSGATWRRVSATGFHALRVAGGVVWASGAEGRVATRRVD